MSISPEDLYSIDNLYLAYRKAKVDVYYERSQPMAEAFCEYEQHLHSNLARISHRAGGFFVRDSWLV